MKCAFFSEKSALFPEKSGLFPEKSGLFSEKSGLFPEKSGLFSEKSGLFQRDFSREGDKNDLNLLVEPISAFDIPRAAQEQGARIEQVGTPSHREGAMLVENGVTHIDCVEKERKEF